MVILRAGSAERNDFRGISSALASGIPRFIALSPATTMALHLPVSSHKLHDRNKHKETTMNDTLTLTGLVATTPRRVTTGNGLDIASFRMASTQRHYDRTAQKWIDSETNWYTVTAFRTLAVNIYNSINKGDRVIVTGALQIREWNTADKSGTQIEIHADTIGHDLSWGTSTFSRTHSAATAADVSSDTETTSPVTENELA